jgi:glycosyltransferase involved in cell wall biosynthesis
VSLPRLPWGQYSERPRVCIVRQNDNYDESVQREADALTRAGFDVEVLCMRGRDGKGGTEVERGVTITALPATLHRQGLISYCIDYAWFWTLVASTLTVRHLRRPYSVVQVNTMPDLLVFSAIVPKLLGSRVIAFLKEPTPELFETLYGRPWLTNTLKRVEQAAIRFSDHALTVTEELREVYISRGAPAEDISVIRTGNAVPPAIENGNVPARTDKGEGFVVLCHGTIEERYGLDTIVDAAHLLRGTIPGLQVVFTGRGGGIDAVKRHIVELDVADVVRFEGWVTRERLSELLAMADVGIVAQKASPYSHLVTTNKMIDYWIFGLPTIASRLRSVSSAYDDSVLEYFEPGDAASLADAIRRLHDNPSRRAELARNGRAALEFTGWDAQEELFLEVYDSLLRGYDPVQSG